MGPADVLKLSAASCGGWLADGFNRGSMRIRLLVPVAGTSAKMLLENLVVLGHGMVNFLVRRGAAGTE
jgi:hypothetical protein